MSDYINGLLEKTQKFGLLDFAIFKVSLIFLGIILGIYLSDFFADYLGLVWVIFGLSFAYVLYCVYIRK